MDRSRSTYAFPEPTPVFALSVRTGSSTAITRKFQGDDAKRCRRCPAGRCTAYQGTCLIVVPGHVSPAAAVDYRVPSTVQWASVPRHPFQILGLDEFEGGAN